VSLADAVSGGFISPGFDSDQLATNMAVMGMLGDHVDRDLAGIRDPRTGDELSLPQAIMAGIVDLSTGELVNPDTGERWGITDSLGDGKISSELGRQLISAMNRNSLANSNVDLATGRYVDPSTGESLLIDEAISSGRMEPAAVFLLDPVTGRLTSLSALVDSGSFNPVSGKLRNPSTGQEISVATAERSGISVADFDVENFIPPEKRRIDDLLGGPNNKASDTATERTFVTPGQT